MKDSERYSQNCPVESKELQGRTYSQWLGGFFEAGGSVSFDVLKSKRYAWPEIRVCDENIQSLARIRIALRAEDLSIVSSKSDKSSTLTLTRARAVEVASRMKQYTPSRKAVIDLIEWWAEVSTIERKYQVGLEYKRIKSKQRPICEEEYHPLLAEPAFVAGLLDSRGKPFDLSYSVYSKANKKEYLSHRVGIALYSGNVNLLQALHERFLGSNPLKANGTYVWKVEGENYKKLMDYTNAFSVVHRKKGG